LIHEEFAAAPAISSTHPILVRHDVDQKRRPRQQRGMPTPPLNAVCSNDLWTVDFGGQFQDS